MASSAGVSALTHTIAVRGTMTSRTTVSPKANTDAIMSRSSWSTVPCASAASTSSRISISEVANGPSRKPLPGVSALPRRMRTFASGPSAVPSIDTGPATASATG
nr:hypothetical protein GCM10025732_56920 [Glycomyces mayteni]